MKITLRKANAIQNSIQDALRSIRIVADVDINEFQNPLNEIDRARTELLDADQRRQQLLTALFAIRSLVGTANANSGIDRNLAKAAYIDRRISQLGDFADHKPMVDMAVITGKLEKISNRKEDSREALYGRSDVVSTSVLTQEQINSAKDEIKNLKKQKQKVNDEILELNIKTEIELDQHAVTTLQAEGLI